MALNIYNASAGSGKTFTLVKEYLKITSQNPYAFKNILAITFTRKATREMKERILEYLEEIANYDGSSPSAILESIYEDLQKENKQYSKELIVKNARITREQILQNYSRFEVSTIDSLFTTILRSIAKEMQLPIGYRIEIEQKEAINTAVQQFYADLAKHGTMKQWLIDASMEQMRSDKSWEVDAKLNQAAKRALVGSALGQKMEMTPFLADLKNLEKETRKKQTALKEAAKDIKERWVDLIKYHGLGGVTFKAGSANYFDKFDDFKTKPTATFKKLAAGEATWCAKKEPSFDEVEMASSEMNAMAAETLKFIKGAFPEYEFLKQIQEQIPVLGLISQMRNELKHYRDRENILLLSDHSQLLAQSIEGNPAPFILEKIGSQFQYLFIDEFQDTSDDQWALLRLLAENVLSQGGDVLIVGDIKQSIYGWRGGNMDLLRTEVKSYLAPFYSVENDRNLEFNFRSREGVVNFNNSFFTTASKILSEKTLLQGWEPLSEAYQQVTQKLPDNHGRDGGWVELEFYAKKREEKEQPLFEAVIEKIHLALDLGYQYKDILILYNKKTHADKTIIALSEHGIPFISADSLRINNHQQVKLLLLLLRYLSQQAERVELMELYYRLRSNPQVLKSDPDSYFRSVGSSLENIQTALINELPKEFKSEQETLAQLPAAELLRRIIDLFSDELLTFNDYTIGLIEQCRAAADFGHVTAAGFLNWWEALPTEINLPPSSSSNAIPLLTVHKAKGLESEIVIYINSRNDLSPSTTQGSYEVSSKKMGLSVELPFPIKYRPILLDSPVGPEQLGYYRTEVLERLNVLYVALTRAKSGLFIVSEAPPKKPGTGEAISTRSILQEVVNDSAFALKNNSSHEERHQYLFGNYCKKEIKEKKESTTNEKRLEISKGVDYDELVNLESSSDEYFKLLATESADAIELGIKAHLVLEKLQHPRFLSQEIQRLKDNRSLTEEEIPAIKESLEQLLSQEKVADWFDERWEVYPERSILANGRSYQPDRVIINDKHAVVIDYKKSKHQKKYEKQVRDYGFLLEQMGMKKVEKYLVYVESNQIVEVNE